MECMSPNTAQLLHKEQVKAAALGFSELAKQGEPLPLFCTVIGLMTDSNKLIGKYQYEFDLHERGFSIGGSVREFEFELSQGSLNDEQVEKLLLLIEQIFLETKSVRLAAATQQLKEDTTNE